MLNRHARTPAFETILEFLKLASKKPSCRLFLKWVFKVLVLTLLEEMITTYLKYIWFSNNFSSNNTVLSSIFSFLSLSKQKNFKTSIFNSTQVNRLPIWVQQRAHGLCQRWWYTGPLFGLFINTLPLYFTISDIVYRWRYECRYLIKEVPEKKSESYQKFFKNAKFKCPVGLIPVTIFCKQWTNQPWLMLGTWLIFVLK